MFKKILLLVILAAAMVGCTAEDIAIWKDSDRRAAERGVRCFQDFSGYYYCKDRYGTRVY